MFSFSFLLEKNRAKNVATSPIAGAIFV